MNIGETDGAIMSDVKPVGFVQKTKLERLVSGYSVVAALYKDNFADEVPIYSQKTITALQAEIEALRKDGERYAWLRDQHEGLVLNGNDADGIMLAASVRALAFTVFMPDKWEHESLVPVPIGDLDEAVDTAIAKEKQQESLK